MIGAMIRMLGIGVAAILLAASAASSAVDARRVIKVYSKSRSGQLTDKDPQGPSKGDVLVGTSVLRNAAAQFGKRVGARVGSDRFRQILDSPTASTFHVTATLPGGTITCRGKMDATRNRAVLRVTGGIGTFAHATGTCESSPAPTNPYNADSINVYRLQLP
jgi:hypothetical protein